MTTDYDALIAHTRETVALMQADELLGWDQETMMPPRGAAMRAEQAAALSTAIHARATDPCLGEWLERIDEAALPAPARRNVTLIRRSYRRATRLPQGLGAALARATAAGVAAWTEARKAQDMADALGLSAPLTQGSVVASDAFFPFADGLQTAAEAGATAVIQPGGSMRDDEVIAAADAAGLAMVFTGMRHFRH